MHDVEVTIKLPEALVKQATALGMLADEQIAALIRTAIQTQLAAMAKDANIQREISEIEADFRTTEFDGLDAQW
jgi:hypothetical protein